MIEGISKDEPIVTNENGGKQSNSPYAMHLIDPMFLAGAYDDSFLNKMANFLCSGDKGNLLTAVELLRKDTNPYLEISKVLREGAEKYKANNWRLIPQEEHINHALVHYLAYLEGDTQDDHREHCMCRLMMAYATDKSKGFEYTRYVEEG